MSLIFVEPLAIGGVENALGGNFVFIATT